MDATLDLTALADRAGVSIRTVRYYIQQGLIPKPEARGPGAHYTEEHLHRLLLIKRLQKEHLPLAEIRRAIESGAAESASPVSARDYINTVLQRSTTQLAEASATPTYSATPEDRVATRSQWERITLAPDIELHIRRPLSRIANRQVDRLVDIARDIFKEDQ